MFVTILRHEAMRHGGVDVAWSGDRIVGAAVWMPPDTWKPPSAAQQLRSVPGFMRAFGRRISAASALMTASLKTFPRKRLVNFCTKGFRGYAGYVATGAIRSQADALSWHDRMLGQWRGPIFERLGWAPIQSGIEKRHGVAGPSLSVEGRRDTDP